MEFAGRGSSAADAAAAADDGRSFTGPPPTPQHGDTMMVIRDALLSQLQKDRLRQEIIVAELAKIERAMALRSASHHGIASAGAERTAPATFAFSGEQFFMPHSREAAGPERCIGVDEARDLKKGDGVHGGAEFKSDKPAMEDHGRECLKTSSGTGEAAGQENAALDDCKLQGSSETILAEKTSPAVKWSCAICKVEAPSEANLLQHFAGQKHQSNVATLLSKYNAVRLKAKPTAEETRNARQYADKRRPTWVCRFCQSNCTCKSDLENHLRGKRHKDKLQALLEECENMARNHSSQEVKLEPNIAHQNAENPASAWNCSLCQAKCTCQSNLENHLRGKRHQVNFLVLQVEAMQYVNGPRQIDNVQKQPPRWGCGICQAKCNSESQFQDHCRSMGHQEKEALHKEGSSVKSSSLHTAKNIPSYCSNSKGEISQEMEIQRTLYFCKLCNLQCNSKNTLAEHRRGKKHSDKVEKRRSLSFCEVCNLQCNSEKMLAHHQTGKKHLDLSKLGAR